MAQKKRAWAILGDASDYFAAQEQSEQSRSSQEVANSESLDARDPEQFPADVWRAASTLPNGGAALLRSYQDIADVRELYRTQLDTLTARRPAGVFLASKTNVLGSIGRKTHLFASAKTISSTVKDTSQIRRLSKYDQQQAVWEQTVMDLANQTAHLPEDLAMQRGVQASFMAHVPSCSLFSWPLWLACPEADLELITGPEWRQRMELLNTLHMAKPVEDKLSGSDAWHMSLRGAWERLVPVGAAGSGLYSTIRERPPLAAVAGGRGMGQQPGGRDMALQVGRPLDPLFPGGPTTSQVLTQHSLTGLGEATLGRSLTRRGRDWTASEVLRQRLEQYADTIHRQQPHPPDLAGLAVRGESYLLRIARLLAPPISLAEVEQHLAATDPTAYQAYREVQAAAAAAQEAADQAEATTAEQVAAGAAAAPSQPVVLPGVHLEVSTQHLLLHCQVNNTHTASFTLTNKGTVAVAYKWQRAAEEPPPFGRPLAQATSAGPPSPLPQPQPCLHALHTEGTLLPGASCTFDVLFAPQHPGCFTEAWSLATTPALSDRRQPLALSVRGLAVPEDVSGLRRSSLQARLAQEEKLEQVQDVVQRLLADVRPQPAPDFVLDASHAEQAVVFERENSSEWLPLYYQPAGFTALEALYKEARAGLAAALEPVPVPELKGKKAAAPGGSAKGKPGQEPAAPAPMTWPEAWSGRVSDVTRLAREVADQGQALAAQPEEGAAPMAAAAAQTAKQVHDALSQLLASQVLRVPLHEKVVLRHAMRGALLRLADAVDAKLSAVHADYASRQAEAAAAAADGSASGAGAPAPVGPQWLADKCRVGTKVQVKQLSNLLWEEVAREKAAIGEWLWEHIQALDGQVATTLVGGAAASAAPGAELEQLYWSKHVLLREWSRLNIPWRPDSSLAR
ncbi:hypothetical protein QJQ45_014564 [Haematococcus lacustris]|nr:hypothetical protein QJQ45_014564 [Haematococcus lacustris]